MGTWIVNVATVLGTSRVDLRPAATAERQDIDLSVEGIRAEAPLAFACVEPALECVCRDARRPPARHREARHCLRAVPTERAERVRQTARAYRERRLRVFLLAAAAGQRPWSVCASCFPFAA